MDRLMKFVRLIPKIKRLDSKAFDRAYVKSKRYFQTHRELVVNVGDLLGIDMYDHDLTKTTLMQLALGLLWHWDSEFAIPQEMKEVVLDAVHAGHLELEDHHSEYTKNNVCNYSRNYIYKGAYAASAATNNDKEYTLGIHRLFADRLAVHLQKDKKDDQLGWDINPCFIPVEMHYEFMEFQEKFRSIDLYQAFDNEVYQ